MLHGVHDQPDAASVHVQFDRLLHSVSDTLPAVAEHRTWMLVARTFVA